VSGNSGIIVFVAGFLACFGLIFVLAFANLVRILYAAKNGGLEAAPKFCPHCGEPTLLGGNPWYPTSPAAALRGASVRIGFLRLGGPTTRAGWTCVKCGGTADKPPAR
jgi:ribosomal protein S27AE